MTKDKTSEKNKEGDHAGEKRKFFGLFPPKRSPGSACDDEPYVHIPNASTEKTSNPGLDQPQPPLGRVEKEVDFARTEPKPSSTQEVNPKRKVSLAVNGVARTSSPDIENPQKAVGKLNEGQLSDAHNIKSATHNSQSGDTSGINTLLRANTSNIRNSIQKIWKGKEQKIGDTILEDARDTDIVIPIMGPTGVGKSTFINTAAGSDSAVTVGHGLESCTAAIQHAIIPHPSKEDPHRRVIFVDTPGFDDTYVDDSEILRRISVWLARSYSDRVRLAGVIYMHEISQTRMLGTSRKNLGMFTKLIGDDAAKNVILATTKWGDVEQEVGEGREKQLRANFWKEMIDQGSRTAQFHNTYESAWAIVNLIVDNDPVDALQIQTELVELEKLIPETEAGQTLRATLTKLIDDHQKTLSQLKKNKSRKGDDDLQERLKDTEKQLRALLGQIQELKVPVGQRIMGWFNLKQRFG